MDGGRREVGSERQIKSGRQCRKSGVQQFRCARKSERECRPRSKFTFFKRGCFDSSQLETRLFMDHSGNNSRGVRLVKLNRAAWIQIFFTLAPGTTQQVWKRTQNYCWEDKVAVPPLAPFPLQFQCSQLDTIQVFALCRWAAFKACLFFLFLVTWWYELETWQNHVLLTYSAERGRY